MKRLLILISILLLLTACSAPPAEKVEPEDPPPPAETPVLPEEVPSPEPEEVPEPEEAVLRYKPELVRLEGTKQAADGTILLTYNVQVPQLRVIRENGSSLRPEDTALTPAEQEALDVAEVFNQRFGDWLAEEHYTKLAEMAAEDLVWFREEDFTWYDGYVCELDCEMYRTERLVSISGLYYSYTGGAHPNTSWLTWNFDLTEGTFIGPEILADGAELRSAVAEEILRQARTPREDGSIPAEEYWEDHETLIADWINYAVSFDETGMTVIFSPYELAPYAAGPQEFTFSYDWLAPHLGPHGQALLGLEPTK